MTSVQLSLECEVWRVGNATWHPPADAVFLAALAKAGFVAFTGPAGMCGGKSESRTAIAIHRGRGTKWELVFREHDHDVVTTITTDLPDSAQSVIAWLEGKALSADQDSLHAIAS